MSDETHFVTIGLNAQSMVVRFNEDADTVEEALQRVANRERPPMGADEDPSALDRRRMERILWDYDCTLIERDD